MSVSGCRRLAAAPGSALLAAMSLALGGCAATRGGPESFLAVESATAAQKFKNTAMKSLAEASTDEVRNLRLTDAMADVDVFYVRYREQLLRSDAAFNAGIDLVSLMSDLAGRLTDSIGVKDNYLTLGALLNGTRSTVNNRFLFAQTSLALVKGMDAARAARALEIKRRQGNGIDVYSGRDAYADVLKYQFDGTLAGGLLWLQANAASSELADANEMRTLRVPTPEEYESLKKLREDIDEAPANAEKMRAALELWGAKPKGTADDAEVASQFHEALAERFESRTSAASIRKDLVTVGYLEDEK